MTDIPTPTGRLHRVDNGVDLVLTRTFRAPVEDVWAAITDPDRTARWYGRWKGEAAPGHTIKVQPAFEDQAPWTDMRIDACDAPTRLALSASDTFGDWHIELLLTADDDGTTELRFTHHLATTDGIGDIGPGWEYYLDMLAATHANTPLPAFDDYHPAQKPYFDSLAADS
ncbi:SRPBCC family protein [Embleya sp. NPDC127516]|uniref:SRPBCC family protein n=1 Tax=Embleya sp. NPDC127516 TaxID=3363990 RepID=UPI00381872BD